jgi:hypothetical protein
MKYRSILHWDEEHQRKAGIALFVFVTLLSLVSLARVLIHIAASM